MINNPGKSLKFYKYPSLINLLKDNEIVGQFLFPGNFHISLLILGQQPLLLSILNNLKLLQISLTAK
jgi:hypothetical protein